jgi:hypothetical protein
MICRQETLVLMIIITLLISTIIIMYLRTNNQLSTFTNSISSIEGFNEIKLDELLAQYQQLTNDQKKQLATIIGRPIDNDDMIHKSAIPPQRECPKSEFNNLDYVKRSSIPPCPEPKPCIAPKVVVSADLCKKQECPPCPSVNETIKIETKRVPVFVTKTVRIDADGNETVTVEESDVLEGDNFLSSPIVTNPETTVSNPMVEKIEPEGNEKGLFKKFSNFLFK